ncbi:hypothetical protein Tco_0663475 [Tanacetum coccineum]
MITIRSSMNLSANCCGQVLWIHNQMMDYGFNFMNTKIHIDNERTISVIKNPVAHSKTKHIEIQFHFIRDCYEKILIEDIKIHTNSNVADLLTKDLMSQDLTFWCYLGSRESLERDMDGTAEFLLSNLFDFWLTKVSTDRQSLYSYKSVRENTEDEGEASERPSDSQPIPSPPHPSEDQPQTQTDPSPRPSPSIAIPDSNPEGSGGNHGGQSSSDRSLSWNKDGLTLQSVYDLSILDSNSKGSGENHGVSHPERNPRRNSRCKRMLVSKQRRKPAKSEPTVHKDPSFDDLDDDANDYMKLKDDQDEEGQALGVNREESARIRKNNKAS